MASPAPGMARDSLAQQTQNMREISEAAMQFQTESSGISMLQKIHSASTKTSGEAVNNSSDLVSGLLNSAFKSA